VAAGAVGVCIAAAFGTDVRAALPAIVAGCGTVIVLNLIADRGQGTALAQAVTALVLAITVGAGLFTVVVGDDTDRYGAILSPSGDPSYEAHVTKWSATLDELEGHPFGMGLATAGRVQEEGTTPYVTAGSYAIDNSYLKIAFEQGFPVLALFAAGMIALFVGLARRATKVRAGPVRGLAIGAAGTMATGLAMFLTGGYIESLAVLFLWIPIGAAIGALAAAREEEAEAGASA
jgi:O-antigen ligase